MSNNANEAVKKRRKGRYHLDFVDESILAKTKLVQVVLPIEEERTTGSAALPVRWSSVDKDESVRLEPGGETAYCLGGHRSVRATHGVSEGTWFFELEIVDYSSSVTRGPPDMCHCRVGWAMDRVPWEDMDAPIGYSLVTEGDDGEAGFSYAYGSREGAAYHRSRGREFGSKYGNGDVIGCLIELPSKPPSPINPKLLNVGSRYHCPLWCHYWIPEEPNLCQGSRISFFKNGERQAGDAFVDVWQGIYYPAASFYYGGGAKANFGPTFRYPPDEDFRPMSDCVQERQVWSDVCVEQGRNEDEASVMSEKCEEGEEQEQEAEEVPSSVGKKTKTRAKQQRRRSSSNSKSI
mmetsp:Transcript_8704/g.29039  ORF Transcript_8704/g.29039 Transcript_8704/m.29039 type:complete len:349 (-) Transcript_8704:3171-4217(-)